VNGRSVSEPEDVTGALDGLEPGDEVAVQVEAGGDSREVQIELGTRPANP
jgi:S1-C subfamily serine protease